MASVQRSDGSAGGNILVRHEERNRLPPGSGVGQQILEQIIWQTAVTKRGVTGRWNGVGSAGTRGHLGQCVEAAIRADALQEPLIVFEGGASNVPAYPQDCYLSKSYRLFIGHPQDAQSAKIRAQDANTVIETLEWDDQHQNALGYQPSVGVVEEKTLHAVVGDRPDLRVVGWIQVQQREGLGFRDGIEG